MGTKALQHYAPNILIGVCLILFTMAVGFLAGDWEREGE